jgi:hypothetical protein
MLFLVLLARQHLDQLGAHGQEPLELGAIDPDGHAL